MSKNRLFAVEENPYKVLGTRSNASPERIKICYLDKIKEYPPEQYPEQFRIIREAYETLKDPIKKAKYDLTNKYGGRVERLLEQAFECLRSDRLDQAFNFAQEALELSKGNFIILLHLAEIDLLRGNINSFHRYYKEAEEAVQKKYRPNILCMKASELLDWEDPDMAIEVFRDLEERFPRESYKADPLRIRAYEMLGENDEAWKVIEGCIQRLKKPDIDDLHFYLKWHQLMAVQGRLEKEQEVVNGFKEYLGSFQSEEEKEILRMALEEEQKQLKEGGFYVETGFFLDLLYHLTSDPEYLKKLEDLEEVIELAREMDRLRFDYDVFPPVKFKALEFFNRQYGDEELLEQQVPLEFRGFLAELEESTVNFLQGIESLQEKFPAIFKHFQADWEEERRKKEKGLSPEEKRLGQQVFKMNENYQRDESGTLIKTEKKVGRNSPCPCGSKKKYKKCCGKKG